MQRHEEATELIVIVDGFMHIAIVSAQTESMMNCRRRDGRTDGRTDDGE